MSDGPSGANLPAPALPRFDGVFGVGSVKAESGAAGGAGEAYWLRTLVEGMPQLVWRSCDMGSWTWSSPQWRVFTGQSLEQSLRRGWLEAVHPGDRAATLEAWAGARSHGMLDVEFRVRRAADGGYVWHRTRSLPVLDEQDKIVEWLGTTTDIEDLKQLQERQAALLDQLGQRARELQAEVEQRRQAEQQLLYAAFHDDLTKLHNRAYFMGRCRTAFKQRDGAPAKQTALLTLDLDRFKLINDSLGHGSGDVVLTGIAGRLRSLVGEQDVVARIGGNQFALLIEDIGDAGLGELAGRILAEVRRPFWFGRRQVHSSCSLGAAWLDEQQRAEELLRDADMALYEAKRDGPGQYRVFAAAMRNGALGVLDLQTDLVNAVRHAEFELHYQPICDAVTAVITGVEALIRWRHPSRGLLSPGAFLLAAEQQGLMRDIGRFALAEGSNQLRRWRDQFPGTPLALNVNLSAVELKDPDLVPAVAAALAASGLEPQHLKLEITESVFLEQPEQAAATLQQLRKLGVRIALDDFGTGYSSLSYLEQYELDTIKIDQSFVARMLTHPRTRAVVAAIVRLGGALGLDIVAEGVESQEQQQALIAAGCGSVQGFFLGRPMPAEALTAALQRQARSPR